MAKSELEISDAAAGDLASVFRYTRERWGEAQALTYIDALDAGFDRIAARPDLGRDRSDALDGARSRLVAKHVVFYQVTEERVTILRVLHPAQDPMTLRGFGSSA